MRSYGYSAPISLIGRQVSLVHCTNLQRSEDPLLRHAGPGAGGQTGAGLVVRRALRCRVTRCNTQDTKQSEIRCQAVLDNGNRKVRFERVGHSVH